MAKQRQTVTEEHGIDDDMAAALGVEQQQGVVTLHTARKEIQMQVTLADRVPCGKPGCKGHLTCYSTHTEGEHPKRCRVQYYSCFRCNWKPDNNKLVTPLG